jgi:hypothetical protein
MQICVHTLTAMGRSKEKSEVDSTGNRPTTQVPRSRSFRSRSISGAKHARDAILPDFRSTGSLPLLLVPVSGTVYVNHRLAWDAPEASSRALGVSSAERSAERRGLRALRARIRLHTRLFDLLRLPPFGKACPRVKVVLHSPCMTRRKEYIHG